MNRIMKKMHYRVGLFGWKVAAKAGIPLSFRAYVHKDREANVFWATSPDIDGLAVEGASLDELMREVTLAADELIGLQIGTSRSADPVVLH